MKRILVPTDFSDCARDALDFAAHMARKVNGEIYLLHVLEEEDEYTGASTSGEWISTIAATETGVPHMIGLLRETKVIMEDLKGTKMLEGLTIFDNIEVGTPGIQINHAAKRYNADIIIMGTHGARGLHELFVGSNAEKVVQHSDRPVLTIPNKVLPEPQKIIFASDFSSEADEIFKKVMEFAAIYKTTIHLLTVTTPDKFESAIESRDHVDDFRIRHGLPDCPFSIYNDYSSESGILHFAKDINADIIAIGTHGRKGLARLFNGSLSEELVNHSFCPVLTVNFPKPE